MAESKTSVVVDLTGNLIRKSERYGRAMTRFSKTGSRSMRLLSRSAHATGKALDALGNRYTALLSGAAIAYKSTQAVMDSAGLDKNINRVGQTAGATRVQVNNLRKDIFDMAQRTGQPVDDLLGGFNDLVQAGLSWEQATATIKAINPAMAVTGANANTLASGLTVAAEAFKFDLSKPGQAAKLLDQMTVAGRLANAELEDLSDIFSRVGVNAKAAGFDFAGTLGFTEQLSKNEKQPERLATLVDSSLRIFTKGDYQKRITEKTGISFYDANNDRRKALDVLDDIAAKYKKLSSDAERDNFISEVFGSADQDTIKGLRALLSGDSIKGARTMTEQIRKASGTIAKDLPGAINNAVDQTRRLKLELKEAADGFAQPINAVITRAIQSLLDDNKISGKEMLVGGAAATALTGGILFAGKKLVSRGMNIAKGGVLSNALGTLSGNKPIPVYVVNNPGGGLGGGGKGGRATTGKARSVGKALGVKGQQSRIGRAGAFAKNAVKAALSVGGAVLGTSAGALAAAGVAGWGVGTLIHKFALEGTEISNSIGRGVAQVLSIFGNDTAKAAINAELAAKQQTQQERPKRKTSIGKVIAVATRQNKPVAQAPRQQTQQERQQDAELIGKTIANEMRKDQQKTQVDIKIDNQGVPTVKKSQSGNAKVNVSTGFNHMAAL